MTPNQRVAHAGFSVVMKLVTVFATADPALLDTPSAALKTYRELGMAFWPEQAEAELSRN